jgi:integrase
MKNFKLIKGITVSKGMVLLNKVTKTPYEPFSKYVSVLLDKGLANNTIDSYADHTAAFLDFMLEIQLQPNEIKEGVEPSSIFSLYYEFLVFGVTANNPLIVGVAKELNKTVSISNDIISGQITSALDYFLHVLEVDTNKGFLELFRLERHISPQQQKHIEKSSWLSQVIRKTGITASNKKTVLFPRAKRARKISGSDSADTYEKALPTNSAFKFLLKQKKSLEKKITLTKSRNYLLDSLLAASGVRSSEAVQVLIDDIDVKNKTIKIVSIDKRAYKGLTEVEHDKLVFKGRQTEKTLLIEPFASMFWDALKIYLDNYYKSNVSHKFLFQKNNARPYFSGDRPQRCKDFKARLRLHMGDEVAQQYVQHSLRHTYGVYTHNHLPIHDSKGNTTGQYGLPLAYVKILMGHSSLTSTEGYGKKDSSVAEVLITLANNKIKYSGLTLTEIIMDVKTKKLEELKQEFDKLEAK